MCVFLGGSPQVSRTRIYGVDLGAGEHATVYAMSVVTVVPVAMVLPVPVREGLGDQGVRFIDLSGYPGFFADLERLFAPPRPKNMLDRTLICASAARPPLEVHEVGEFVASHVPTEHDFDRLDPRFRVPESVGSVLFPRYLGWGYVVFQLRAKARPQDVHPMAYAYQTRDPERLFYPTVHVHDGATVPKREHFDHTLYVQCDEGGILGWQVAVVQGSRGSNGIDVGRTQGLVGPSALLHRHPINGVRPNRDLVLTGMSGNVGKVLTSL